MFAANIAAEFNTGSIRVLLTIDPRRASLLAGKTAALAGFIALAVLIASFISGIVAVALAGSQDVDTAAWTTTEAVTGGLALYANVILSAIVYGLFGILLGVITRSSAISIAAGVAYFLIIESFLLQSFWNQAEKWLPAGVLTALTAGSNQAVTYSTALLYTLAAVAIATIVFQRRDITD